MTQADIQKYREQIEADLAWRLEEIAFFAKQLNHFKARNVSEEEREKAENDKKRFRKSLVFILYAHFEGFFRFAFETYVNALNEDNIALSKTIDVLVVSSLYKIFGDYDYVKSQIEQDRDEFNFNKMQNKIGGRLSLLREIDNFQKTGIIKLPISSNHMDKHSIIYTESNLSPEIVEKIIYRLGFNASTFGLDDVGLKNTFNAFLMRRNAIAHGDNKFKEGLEAKQWDEYKRAFDKVVNLIPIAIYNALSQKLYLKPEFR